ncbi:MAG TPA: hypothetical protein VI485_03375 [Vicinamibacterales bacterium]|nr:hypothetical protein [Vicinamibacterales bacterium]
MRIWNVTLLLSAAVLVVVGALGPTTVVAVTVDECVDQNYNPAPCKDYDGWKGGQGTTGDPFGGERPPNDGRCGTFGGFCCWCHMTVPGNVGAPASVQPAVLAAAPLFWTRHDALARKLPRKAEHRTMRAQSARPGSYNQLLVARTSSTR